MPNIANLTVTKTVTKVTTNSSLLISGQVIDNKKVVLGDFTGPNAIALQVFLDSLDDQESQDFGSYVLNQVLKKKFPGVIG